MKLTINEKGVFLDNTIVPHCLSVGITNITPGAHAEVAIHLVASEVDIQFKPCGNTQEHESGEGVTVDIRKARKESGLTQHQLAVMAGVSRSTIAMWETGQSAPRFDKILPLSAALNLSPETPLKRQDST